MRLSRCLRLAAVPEAVSDVCRMWHPLGMGELQVKRGVQVV